MQITDSILQIFKSLSNGECKTPWTIAEEMLREGTEYPQFTLGLRLTALLEEMEKGGFVERRHRPPATPPADGSPTDGPRYFEWQLTEEGRIFYQELMAPTTNK